HVRNQDVGRLGDRRPDLLEVGAGRCLLWQPKGPGGSGDDSCPRGSPEANALAGDAGDRTTVLEIGCPWYWIALSAHLLEGMIVIASDPVDLLRGHVGDPFTELVLQPRALLSGHAIGTNVPGKDQQVALGNVRQDAVGVCARHDPHRANVGSAAAKTGPC